MREQLGKVYVGFSVSAVVLWAALLFLVFATTPGGNGYWELIGFYSALFGAVVSSITLIGVMFRKRFSVAPIPEMVRYSLRQAALVGLLLLLLLVLQAQSILFWWVGASLVLLFICVEVLFNL